MKKKFLAALLCMTMAVAMFAGCGEKADEQTNTEVTDTQDVVVEEPAEEPVEEPAEEPVVEEPAVEEPAELVAPAPMEGAAAHGQVSFSDSAWWTEKNVTDILLCGYARSQVDYVRIYSAVDFQVGYNNAEGGWTQAGPANEHIISDFVVDGVLDANGEQIEFAAKLGLSKNDGVMYDFYWDVFTVEGAGEPAGAVTE